MRTAPLLLLLGACSVWDIAVPFTKNLPPPKAPQGVTAHRDLVFAERPERDLKLDVFVPDDVEAPPVVVYVFGGGFFMGSRHSVAQETAIWAQLDQGIAVASVDYRYSSEALFPAQARDVSAALCWLRAHGDEVGIDADRLAVSGQSAGGHLSSLIGIGGDDPELLDCEDWRAPDAIVDFFGPTHFDAWTPDDSEVYDEVLDAFGGDLDPERVALADVLDRVDPADPPLRVFHGDADTLVPLDHSTDLAAVAEAAGVPVELQVFPGAGHGGPDFASQAVQEDITDFLTEAFDAAR